MKLGFASHIVSTPTVKPKRIEKRMMYVCMRSGSVGKTRDGDEVITSGVSVCLSVCRLVLVWFGLDGSTCGPWLPSGKSANQLPAALTIFEGGLLVLVLSSMFSFHFEQIN